ncbi:MAG: hypothetical protein JWN34_2584 [Bryobacterales bacterium]|nr:hypothetical protein [Bryobacterales bacterium]
MLAIWPIFRYLSHFVPLACFFVIVLPLDVKVAGLLKEQRSLPFATSDRRCGGDELRQCIQPHKLISRMTDPDCAAPAT